ncbi:hypothetical protein [Geminicoccus harenae]|uniref:hypothetical protein n=1 Tax=Geminicoccus harenae TaxID=2498453 RepID=UPI001C953084|nr:hypothetical protein [Geminicoccus harenae]
MLNENASVGDSRTDRPRYMRRDAASDYLFRVWGIRRVPTTLAKLACLGGGPRFVKAGRWPMYREEWLDAWARTLLGESDRAA